MKRSESLLVCGPFQLDKASARLVRGSSSVDVRLRVLEVLRTLIEHQGHFVDYEKLQREAWDGVSVSRHTVAVTMAEAKRALGEYGSWLHCRPKLGYCLGAPQSEELTKMGWHFLNRRTRASLEKAIECFKEALAVDRGDSRAAEGLVEGFLLLGVFAMRPPRDIYPRFLDALHRAVSLQGWTPELRSTRAQGLHMFERRFTDAEREYERARTEQPRLVSAYMRLSLLLTSVGRLEEALQQVQEAERVDPLWPTLHATKCCLYFCGARYEEAVEQGKAALELHPYLHLSRVYYAQALEYSGRVDEGLEQYRLACVMTPDLPWLAALEAAALARHGSPREARRALDALLHRRDSEYLDGYYLALTFDAFGRREEAFAELERAYLENSTTMTIAGMDPRAASLAADPRFSVWRAKVFAGSPGCLSDPIAPPPGAGAHRIAAH